MSIINLEYIDVFNNKETKKLTFSKHIIKSNFEEKSLFALLVDGKSMQPIINDQAVIVADLSNKILENEKIYLVYYENKMWVKKYSLENKNFYSINPEFSHLVYKDDEVKIVAKVLITFTNL
ncbi:S24 family peptidase [Poseidonibacter sp. 1_MG-2023]|uniref:S24 family peptidase n=1 Tax=Poseidonibacter TaxID=2321187 RepID=UPI001E5B7261|nr:MULTISPECIES: S24 family peptidase [Poseidonibacter]MDO6828573.1 S24 family peptidase [Poseidonibacter sp. 1_MG-2023]